MRIIRYAIALAVLVISTHTLAASHESRAVSTTADFVALCDVSTDDPVYAASMAFCLGYIDAVMDYHTALTAGPKYDPIACPDTEVTREEVVAVVLEWARHNAQHLKSETPVHGVMRAASEKWPCSGQ